MKVKKMKRLILITLTSIAIFSFKKDDNVKNKLGATTPAPAMLVQFTPDQADWSTFQSKPLAISGVTSHAPDDIGWIPAQNWIDSQWDGTTIYDPSTMTKARN